MTAFLGSRLVEASYGNTTWRITDVPPETNVATLLIPEIWAHCAKKLKQYDEVIVIPQGGPFRAHLIVMDRGDNFAKMRLLGVTLLNAAESEVEAPAPEAAKPSLPDDAPVFVKWNGPKDRFTVFRVSDRSKIRTGFAIRAEGEEWALGHIEAMAA